MFRKPPLAFPPTCSGKRLLSRFYDRIMAPVERNSLGERRRLLLSSLKGSILEVGAGTGANVPYYGEYCMPVISEPEPSMYQYLLRRQYGTGIVPQSVASFVEALPFAPNSFDHIVSTLVLCSVASQKGAIAEIWRVLRPGGTLLFIEHIRADGRRGLWQDRLQPLWSKLSHGCHPNRDTVTCLESVGFSMDACSVFDPSERFPLLGKLAFQLVLPFVQGVAKKPEGRA